MKRLCRLSRESFIDFLGQYKNKANDRIESSKRTSTRSGHICKASQKVGVLMLQGSFEVKWETLVTKCQYKLKANDRKESSKRGKRTFTRSGHTCKAFQKV